MLCDSGRCFFNGVLNALWPRSRLPLRGLTRGTRNCNYFLMRGSRKKMRRRRTNSRPRARPEVNKKRKWQEVASEEQAQAATPSIHRGRGIFLTLGALVVIDWPRVAVWVRSWSSIGCCRGIFLRRRGNCSLRWARAMNTNLRSAHGGRILKLCARMHVCNEVFN